jgi:hypothetical protein
MSKQNIQVNNIPKTASEKAQAAIDFMTSYGIAFLVIGIGLYIIFQLGIFNYGLAPQFCSSTSAISCTSYTLNSNSLLTLLISQSSGGALTIKGAACATTQNNTNIGPMYGNINVKNYTDALSTYPNNALQNGVTIYPGSTVQLQLYCYNSAGKATSYLGRLFTGYVWINYTLSNLPSNSFTVQQVLSMSTRYT